MALTITRVAGADHVAGNKRVRVRDVEFDAAYPAGGESLTAADVGLRKIEQANAHGVARNTAGTLGVGVVYDYATSKLLAYESGAALSGSLAEVGAESLATYKVRITFIGY